MSQKIFQSLKILKSFLSGYVFRKSTIYLSVTAIVIAFIYIKSVVPEYIISTELTIVDDNNNSSQFEQRSLTSILSMTEGSRPQDDFAVNAYSISNAKYLWDLGYPKIIFSSLYNEKDDFFNPKEVTFSEKLASIIVGYKINSDLEVKDLQNFIRSEVKINSDELTKVVTVSMQYHDPAIAKQFILDLIIGADSVAKNYTLSKSESRVSKILDDLNNVQHTQIIKEGLIELVNRHLFKITSAKSDAPLSINFIQEPVSSQNPVFPRPFLVIFCFIFITLSATFFLRFLVRNRHELN